MTLDELDAEHRYRYLERLGILCEDREPAKEEKKLARKEADDWLKKQEIDDN